MMKLSKILFPLYPRFLFIFKGLFVHIPKNGGTSIIRSLYGRLYRRSHTPIYLYRQLLGPFYNKTFKFCLIRDPVERFVSLYFYFKDGGNKTSDLDFIQQFFMDKNSNFVTLDVFLEIVQENYFYMTHPMFLPQFFWVNTDGVLSVDKIYYFSNISVLFSELNIDNLHLNKSNSTFEVPDSISQSIKSMYIIDYNKFPGLRDGYC